MKRLYVLTAAGLFFLLSCGLKKTPSPSGHSKKITAPDHPREATAFEIIKTMDPNTGEVPTHRLQQARILQLQKFADQKRMARQTVVPGINWTERGPDNVGGRTRAIMYDYNDPTGKKVWAGGVGGGLWYTNDITASPPVWNKVSDTLNNLAISCITQGRYISSSPKMFFGTGEGWGNIDAIRGNGIWRSLDAGATWTHLASTRDNPDFYYVQDILYAENSGGPCGFGTPGLLAATSTGVFKSTDDGNTWTKVLGNGIGGGSIEVAADLESEYYYTYATLGLVGQGGGGIYRSCDAGTTWEEIYDAAADEERIEIAAHYLDAWQMYAVVQNDEMKVKKIMKSSNADQMPATAVSWTNLSMPPFCNLGSGATEFTRGQAWYDLILAVAPFFRNPPVNDHHATAYIGGIDLHKTTSSGSAWSQVSQWASGCGGTPYVHADKHNIVFRPDPVNAGFFPNELLVATDGGIFRSTDGGATYEAKNKTYNITQFYACAIHPIQANYFLAGSQDNSTQKFTSAGMNSTSNIIATDSDGGFCFIDNDNPNVQIATYVYNNFFISTNGGVSFTDQFKNSRGQFINPMDYDHTNNIIYAGDDGGWYYRWSDPASNGPTDSVAVASFNNANVTAVVVSPTVNNRVYFGLDNGSVVRVDDANTGTSKTGVVIRPDLGSNYYLSCIAVDPANENHMLISYSNYGITSVYESSPGTGGSLNWNSVESASLPDMPIRWCMFDPRNSDWAILATEKGIWSTDNLNGIATNWEPTNNNFANTRVDMLRYRASDRLLLAATHGRGLFSTTLPALGPLPVTLLEFTGQLKNHEAWLNWTTSAELNNKGFEIERSYDGAHFRKIGFVSSAGDRNTPSAYSFRDPDITQKENYYRLRQIDLDGSYHYSQLVLLRNPVPGGRPVLVLTNPIRSVIDLQLGAIEKGNAQIRLFDTKGATVFRASYQIAPLSRLRVHLPVEQLPAGVYVFEMISGRERFVTKLMKN